MDYGLRNLEPDSSFSLFSLNESAWRAIYLHHVRVYFHFYASR